MNQNPKVSVLVPVYNGERYLAECLESILSQDFLDMEILISDNNSTDGTLLIVQDYAGRDSRIQWWRNPSNLGLIGNFNACFKKAKGEYVKCICADDKLVSISAVSQMVNCFEMNQNVSVVLSGTLVIDSASKTTRQRNPFGQTSVLDGKRVIINCLEQNKNLLCGSSTMYRKEAGKLEYGECFPQTADLIMGCHFLENGQLAYIASPLCACREHAGQQTKINTRTNPHSNEHILLIKELVGRRWFYETATPQMLFVQIYHLQKKYGAQASEVAKALLLRLGRLKYTTLLLRHKLASPFKRALTKINSAK